MRRVMLINIMLLFFSVKSFAQQWQSFTTQNSGLPGNNVFAVAVSPAGTLWFGTDRGISAYDGSAWYTYSKADCLANDQVNDLQILEPTEIWAATDNGVSAIDVSSLDAITMATPYRRNNTGLLSNKINSIAIDMHHIRWFATDSGVTAFTGRDWISAKSPRVLLKHDVLAIALSPDTLVYCGTEGGGIARLKLSHLDVITGASTIERPWAPIPIDSVYAIYIGEDSLQWFGTSQGLFQHRGIDSKKNWKLFTVANGLPHRQVQAIVEDAHGKIWVGTRGGVACIQKDLSAHVNYSIADGLVNNDVRDMVVAADSSIWFATAGGVSRFSPTASSVKAPDAQITYSFDRFAIYPNPCNLGTSFEFRLRYPTQVEIAIYNLAGQRVRTLFNGFAPGGVQVVQWDGMDAGNCVVPTGLYVARFICGIQIIHKKLLVIK